MVKKAIGLGEKEIAYNYFDKYGYYLLTIHECGCIQHPEEYMIEDIYSYEGERRLEATYSVIDYDWERQSYLALGGDPERYSEGCLDDYMDSIGL